MLKKIFCSFALLTFVLFAQDDPTVGNLTYMKIAAGKTASFEKAVGAHVKKYHGKDQWATWGGKVVNGKRGGQYIVGSSGHFWKDYADRKSSKVRDDQWAAIIRNHVVETSGSSFYIKDLEASYNDKSSPMWKTQIFYTKPGKRGEMLSMLRKSAKVREKTNSDESRGVYYNVSGADQDGLVYIVSRMDDLTDMADPPMGLGERWVKVHGQKDWEESLETWWNLFDKTETEVVLRIPSMNTPQ
mgnify:FL=1